MSSLRTVSVVLTLASAAGLAVWQGCSVYDSSLLLAAEAGSDAPSDVEIPDAGDGCNHARWPGRPTADDDASVQDIEIYNAVSFLDFGTGDASAGPLGYDLDGICTCPGPDSCNPFGDSGTQCDSRGRHRQRDRRAHQGVLRRDELLRRGVHQLGPADRRVRRGHPRAQLQRSGQRHERRALDLRLQRHRRRGHGRRPDAAEIRRQRRLDDSIRLRSSAARSATRASCRSSLTISTHT